MAKQRHRRKISCCPPVHIAHFARLQRRIPSPPHLFASQYPTGDWLLQRPAQSHCHQPAHDSRLPLLGPSRRERSGRGYCPGHSLCLGYNARNGLFTFAGEAVAQLYALQQTCHGNLSVQLAYSQIIRMKFSTRRSMKICQHESVWLMPSSLSKIKEGATTLNGSHQKVNNSFFF